MDRLQSEAHLAYRSLVKALQLQNIGWERSPTVNMAVILCSSLSAFLRGSCNGGGVSCCTAGAAHPELVNSSREASSRKA